MEQRTTRAQSDPIQRIAALEHDKEKRIQDLIAENNTLKTEEQSSINTINHLSETIDDYRRANDDLRRKNEYLRACLDERTAGNVASETHNAYASSSSSGLFARRNAPNDANSSDADSVMTHNLYTQSASNQTSSSSSSPSSAEQIAAEQIDLTGYLDCKMKLVHIMRDLIDNRTYFIGPDGHKVGLAEYEGLAKYVKAGEDPARYLQGEAQKFKTGYNKKRNTFTENTLFIPKFKFHDVLPTQGLLSEQASVRPNAATTEETKKNATPVDEQHATSMSLG